MPAHDRIETTVSRADGRATAEALPSGPGEELLGVKQIAVPGYSAVTLTVTQERVRYSDIVGGWSYEVTIRGTSGTGGTGGTSGTGAAGGGRGYMLYKFWTTPGTRIRSATCKDGILSLEIENAPSMAEPVPVWAGA